MSASVAVLLIGLGGIVFSVVLAALYFLEYIWRDYQRPPEGIDDVWHEPR